jgi:predicted RNA-binding protein (virulence factor B family)
VTAKRDWERAFRVHQGEGWVICHVSKADAEANPAWMEEQCDRVVRTNPDGSVELRFRPSELEKAKE